MVLTSEIQAVVQSLVFAFVDAGRARPVLPAVGRAKLIDVLRQVLVSPDLLAAYCRELAAECVRGEATRDRSPSFCLDLPVERVGHEGLHVLADEQLACLAFDRNGLYLLGEFLHEEFASGVLAPAWWKALERDRERYVAGEESVGRRAVDLVRRSKSTG